MTLSNNVPHAFLLSLLSTLPALYLPDLHVALYDLTPGALGLYVANGAAPREVRKRHYHRPTLDR